MYDCFTNKMVTILVEYCHASFLQESSQQMPTGQGQPVELVQIQSNVVSKTGMCINNNVTGRSVFV